MSQVFNEKTVVPITLIAAGPCFVAQIKTKEKDKYQSIQIGFEKLDLKKVKNAQKNKPFRYLKEFKVDESEIANYEVGKEINASIFQEGDKVKISGFNKGKGFQGAVKKWGFKGRNATHGVKHEHRTLGSVGATGPQKVFKGKKMHGRMGNKRVTIKNLEIIKIDLKNNLIAVKGAVPGRRGTLLEIQN
jgi:large subunit ribosomal protein L3